VICLLWSWTEAQDDDLIESLAGEFTKRVKVATTAQGSLHPYIYLNYAAGGQDVFASYGENNLERLLEVSSKYDPEQVLTKLRPGYIKVTRDGHDI
jgi:hypothetical protein